MVREIKGLLLDHILDTIRLMKKKLSHAKK